MYSLFVSCCIAKIHIFLDIHKNIVLKTRTIEK